MPTGQNRDAGLLLGLEDLGRPADGRCCAPNLTAADLFISLLFYFSSHPQSGGFHDNKQTPEPFLLNGLIKPASVGLWS